MAPAGDGSLALGLAGSEVLCLPSGALWLPAEQALVVADLHLEKGSSYARRGQMLPPYDTRETLDRLEADVSGRSPRRLILLGDSFHDANAESRLGDDSVSRILNLASSADLVWVTGNHDFAGPLSLPGAVVAELDLGGLRFVHEPTPGPVDGEVAGHLHPCARVRGRGGSVRRRCFATNGRRIVLPAFGALTGGLNLRDPAFASLLSPSPLAIVLGSGRLHPVGWASLIGDQPDRRTSVR